MREQKRTLEYRSPEPRRRFIIQWGKIVFLVIIVVLAATLVLALR